VAIEGCQNGEHEIPSAKARTVGTAPNCSSKTPEIAAPKGMKPNAKSLNVLLTRCAPQ
jgi:hypothetical protein